VDQTGSGSGDDCPITVSRSQPGTGMVELQILVGAFRLADGRAAVLLVNQDDRFVAWPNVAISNSQNATGLYEVDPSTGLEAPAQTDTPGYGDLGLTIPAGSARLLVLHY
jgi:hypothetical protein